ncbi:MAG: DUF1573 domain-containing protein [Cyanobacteria bacterium]|nr:DUF1573 domain-containing protein [Cyanobacteriota bacterium]
MKNRTVLFFFSPTQCHAWVASVTCLFFLCLGIGLVSGCSKPKEPQPKISVEPKSVDLGKVDEGVEVHSPFIIRNQGSADLKIYDARSSCGCTTSKIESRVIPAGKETKMDVIVDTSMKQGRVTKTLDVSSNDPEKPVYRVPISMTVPNQHEGLSDKGKAKILTDEKCTSCHVQRGVGLAGKDLFEADCAMCHGENAKGAVGGALIFGDYDNPDYVKHIRDVISYGSKTHKSMPGFLDKAGGPLIKEQVDSLVDYLKGLSKQEKSKSDGGKEPTE